MDCLICFKVFIKEKEYENISPPKSDICARSICKLLEIPNSPRIQEIFKDPVICSKCNQRLEIVHKELVQLEELERKNERIRVDVRKDLENSKNVSQVIQNSYVGEMSKSSKDREQLFEVMKNKQSNAEISSLQIDALPQEIPIDQSTTLPLSPQPKFIAEHYTRNPSNIVPEMDIDKIQRPQVFKMTEISPDPQIEFKMEGRKYPENIVRSRKSQYSKHFYCKTCKAKFFSKSSLLRHMKNHSEIREMQSKPEESLEEFICSECEKPHSSEEELNAHLESALTSKVIHNCSICPEEFWGIQCLEFHQEISHSNMNLDSLKCESKDKANLSKGFECFECGIKLKCKNSLYNHRLIHEPKKFKCSFEGCGKKFHRKDYLKIHLSSHFNSKQIKRKKILRNTNKQKKYKCQFCSRNFWNMDQVRCHLGNEKSEYCKICKEDFKSNGCLRHHNFTIHGMSYFSSSKSVKPRDLVKCQKCNKYYALNQLRRHELTHGNLIKFKCPEIGCEKLFRRKDYVSVHIKNVHNGIKLKCKFDGCEKDFNQKSHLNRHVRMAHEMF